MSHTITISRTTTTSGSALFINTGYLGTLPGLLKLAQLLLGAACVGVVGYYLEPGYIRYNGQKPELFYLLVSVTFLIGTFCLLISCLMSLSTASIISKTLYEVIYHGVAFILYLSAGLTLMIEVNHQKSSYRRDFEPYLAAAMLGSLCQSLLVKYGLSEASSMGSAFHGFLTTASACLLTTALLIACYVLSSSSQQLIRQSIFEFVFNAVACFMYLSASSYMGVAVNIYLYPRYALVNMYAAYPAMTAVYYIGVVVGILHGVDAYISYRYHKGLR